MVNKTTNGSLVFRTGSAADERLHIKSDGKVGINASDPSTNLQIGDAATDSDNVITLGKRVTSSESNLPKIGHHSANGASSSLALCATSSSGKIHFFTGNGGNGFGAEILCLCGIPKPLALRPRCEPHLAFLVAIVAAANSAAAAAASSQAASNFAAQSGFGPRVWTYNCL